MLCAIRWLHAHADEYRIDPERVYLIGQSAGGQKTAGSTGKPGEGQQGGGSASDAAKLREEYARQLQQTKELVDQLRRDDPSFAQGTGGGFTFEQMPNVGVTSPGTEAFKQDFDKWDLLKRQALAALDHAGAALARKIEAAAAKDRLAAGAGDAAPPDYQKQVDAYFKSLPAKR